MFWVDILGVNLEGKVETLLEGENELSKIKDQNKRKISIY
jgi:hypothetical protein